MKRTVFRHEYKYLINVFQYEILKSRLSFINKDPYCQKDGFYSVRSLYMEDLLGNSRFEKDSGTHKRNKIRLRTYNNSHDFILLENKLKVGQLIQKKSRRIPKSLVERILCDPLELNRVLRTEFPKMENRVATKYYTPKAIIEYDREAYVIKNHNNLRINFDKSITTTLDISLFFQNFTKFTKVTNSEQIVLEVKFTNYIPEHIKFLLNPLESNLISFSKYAKSLSSLN